MAKVTPAEIARMLGDAWARYMREYLAEIDTLSGGQLSASCRDIANARHLLDVAVGTGAYHVVPREVRVSVETLPDHIRRKHPQFAPLLDDEPGPATLALRDQLDAVRRDAEAGYGKRPE